MPPRVLTTPDRRKLGADTCSSRSMGFHWTHLQRDQSDTSAALAPLPPCGSFIYSLLPKQFARFKSMSFSQQPYLGYATSCLITK